MNKKTAEITLTDAEAQNLLNLLNSAVKFDGLNSAAPALAIAEKVTKAFNTPEAE